MPRESQRLFVTICGDPLSSRLPGRCRARAAYYFRRYSYPGPIWNSEPRQTSPGIYVTVEMSRPAGMHWQRGHVDAMLALRNLLCNDRWEQEWPQSKARLIAQAQHRRVPACQQRLQTTRIQEHEAVIGAQRAQYAALHPEWLADPPPDPSPPSTQRSARPGPGHPWRRSPIGKARFKQSPQN